MAFSGDAEPKTAQPEYTSGIQALLDLVQADPRHPFFCSHGDGDGAIGIFSVPGGCVALPGLEAQTLCQQHRWSNGSLEDEMKLVVDLTIGGGWSRHFREQPDFYILENPDGIVEVVRFEDRPFEIP